ncbi:MAG: thioesterase [bacterium]|nr:thioesterase [bacterium]
MPRIQLKPLADYPFACEMPVRITDLNYGGHLGNDTLVSLIHEARTLFLASHDFSEMDCGGVSLILGDTGIVYQAEAFAGDLLRIEVAASEPWRGGFRLLYRVTRPADSRTVALVETGMVCFDYKSRKIAGLPDGVRGICV